MNFNKITHAIKEIKRAIYIRRNRIRTLASIKISKGKFNIVLNEKYELVIKKVSRLVLITSIIISFISIPFPYSAVISVFLILIEQLTEKIVFSFVTITLVPFPDFDLWKKANFAATILGVHKYQAEPATVGMFFKDEIAGKKVFEFIRGWNYNNENDLGKGNITVSFVIDEQKSKYAFFAYPNLNRPSIEKFRKNINRRKGSIGKEQITLIAQMMICKLFNYNNSALKFFRQHYTNGNLYHFLPFSGDISNPRPINGANPIAKDYLKIVDRLNLTEKDLEKFLCDYSINWDDNTEVPKSIFSYR